ncbi:signal recognition particle-docking protein FtsY [Candidatus Aerophobetes bacterium]|uniref:Signal recognition particle receptor FtsY n=1 Tax=Aerophobetes bacterium TaxID=2030807 RepID=A0A2A4X5Q7_UNCAE|nr:MAG: signal recognition particle-docking protein FtsY [Candidatus Aerophobetes bacterium]
MLKSWFQKFSKIKDAFKKTRSAFGQKIHQLFSKPLDDNLLDELEQILYEADLGSAFIEKCTGHMRRYNQSNPGASSKECIHTIKSFCLSILENSEEVPSSTTESKPKVILVVGINGSGKTTTLAKLAKKYLSEGKSVLLVAGDTFRAGACKQLSIWAERLKVDCISSTQGSDPASVVFDGLSAALSRNIDIVLVDTAGRLESKTDLMLELEKIRKICAKKIPGSPHETILILDATLGQNAIAQVTTFHQFTPITSLILTKLDGSAKGGVILPIFDSLKIPTSFIGIGEAVDDLAPFDKKAYVDALFDI